MEGIITCGSKGCIRETTDTSTSDHSITQYALPTCEAKENGVCCWHHAEITYTTSQGEKRYLCKACYRRLWSIILAWHNARVETLDAEGKIGEIVA